MSPIEAVRELRKHVGESQQVFATRLGLSIRALANYEKDRAPTGRALAALAQAAAEAGRHDLSYEFMRVLAKELGFSKLKVGLFSSEPASKNPTGYMLVTFEGRNAQDYARAFFETFGRFAYGNPDEKRRAGKLLQDFNGAAFQEWRSR
jgi:transcriptional regulator with XRE-family HTH domain